MSADAGDIAAELIAMARADQDLRAQLVSSGALFGHYHPQMRALHERHAARLAAIMADIGWPTARLVGREASDAAWIIAQHAISRPALMRAARDALASAAASDPAARTLLAYLDDRIALFEGRAQIYGTQFDWDDEGSMSPLPIVDPDHVDARRASVGLGPLADRVVQLRREMEESGERPPADMKAYRQAQAAFARDTGWRAP